MTAVRSRRRSRATGTVVEVWDLDAPDAELGRDVWATAYDDDGHPTAWEKSGRWVTFCVDHGQLCEHETLRLARAHAAAPQGWCQECGGFGR
jgi:hypothetical protein